MASAEGVPGTEDRASAHGAGPAEIAMSSPSGKTPGGGPELRAGHVALAGAPNAGKSTLLNALVGQKLAIVTPRAQTTWKSATGIRTTSRHQMIFLDTPGLLDPRTLLQRSMRKAAAEALADADVVLAVLDASLPAASARLDTLRTALDGTSAPIVAAINKVDVTPRPRTAELRIWAEEALGARSYPLSALTGEGVGELVAALHELLPPGPFLFPEDEVAAEPVRFFVSELVREALFQHYREEIPYSVLPRVEEFREEPARTYIQVYLYAERRSQKGILLGRGGGAIRKLGEDARKRIEAFLGRPIYLDLWVKVLPGWRSKRSELLRFGFRVPEEPEDR